MANLSKGVGGVWACQSQFCIAARDGKKGGDTLEFLATMEGCSLRETAETMHTWFGAIAVQTPPPIDERTEKPQLASKESSEPGTGVNKPLNFALRDIDPYLVSRGVTERADTFYEAADSHATVPRDPLARGARAEGLPRTRLSFRLVHVGSFISQARGASRSR